MSTRTWWTAVGITLREGGAGRCLSVFWFGGGGEAGVIALMWGHQRPSPPQMEEHLPLFSTNRGPAVASAKEALSKPDHWSDTICSCSCPHGTDLGKLQYCKTRGFFVFSFSFRLSMFLHESMCDEQRGALEAEVCT